MGLGVLDENYFATVHFRRFECTLLGNNRYRSRSQADDSEQRLEAQIRNLRERLCAMEAVQPAPCVLVSNCFGNSTFLDEAVSSIQNCDSKKRVLKKHNVLFSVFKQLKLNTAETFIPLFVRTCSLRG